MNSVLRFNLTLPGLDPAGMSQRYRAALDMAELADRSGFAAVTVDEHHGADDGWMPTPLMLTGMIAARTERVVLSLQALLLPLHDPLRVAEDLVAVDLVSGGRLAVTLGLGYRPSEYVAHRKDWSRRGAIMDECLAELIAAWTGAAVDRDGTEVHVTPRPLSPYPPLMVGGSSRASARRAARFGLPLAPPAKIPELEAYYEQLCAKSGKTPMVISPPEHVSLLFVAEDPDRAWREIGLHLLQEATTYASWQTPDIQSSVHSHATTVDELRAEGIYEVLSPSDCLGRAAERGPETMFVLHPLCGGMPLDAAWGCVHLYVEQVLAKQ